MLGLPTDTLNCFPDGALLELLGEAIDRETSGNQQEGMTHISILREGPSSEIRQILRDPEIAEGLFLGAGGIRNPFTESFGTIPCVAAIMQLGGDQVRGTIRRGLDTEDWNEKCFIDAARAHISRHGGTALSGMAAVVEYLGSTPHRNGRMGAIDFLSDIDGHGPQILTPQQWSQPGMTELLDAIARHAAPEHEKNVTVWILDNLRECARQNGINEHYEAKRKYVFLWAATNAISMTDLAIFRIQASTEMRRFLDMIADETQPLDPSGLRALRNMATDLLGNGISKMPSDSLLLGFDLMRMATKDPAHRYATRELHPAFLKLAGQIRQRVEYLHTAEGDVRVNMPAAGSNPQQVLNNIHPYLEKHRIRELIERFTAWELKTGIEMKQADHMPVDATPLDPGERRTGDARNRKSTGTGLTKR